MKSIIYDYISKFTKKLSSYFPYSMLYRICIFVKTRTLTVLISLVFLILAVLGITNLHQENTSCSARTEHTEIIYTLKIEKKDSSFFESIKEGDTIFKNNTDVILGKILSCDTEPAKYITQNHIKRTFEQTVVENQFDGYIKIKATASLLYPDLMIDNESVKIGKSFSTRTENTLLYGYITAIEYDKESAGGFNK